MQRIQEHRIALGRIIKDDRLSGDNRFIAELMSIFMDSFPKKQKKGQQIPTPEEVEATKQIHELSGALLFSRYIDRSGRVRKHADKDEDTPLADIEKEATAIERSAFEALLRGGE